MTNLQSKVAYLHGAFIYSGVPEELAQQLAESRRQVEATGDQDAIAQWEEVVFHQALPAEAKLAVITHASEHEAEKYRRALRTTTAKE